VTSAALFVLIAAVMIVISKTWTSHRRGDRFSINDVVAEDVLRRRRHEAIADQLAAKAQRATLEVDIEPRLAG